MLLISGLLWDFQFNIGFWQFEYDVLLSGFLMFNLDSPPLILVDLQVLSLIKFKNF